MNEQLPVSARPRGVTIIAVVNSVAAVITVAFWLLVWLRLYGPQATPSLSRDAMASTLGFLVADLLWAVPLLVISIPGLLRMRFWGWVAAQGANLLWFYSLTNLWVRDLSLGSITPGDIIFLPFLLISVWAAWYLWVHRTPFFSIEAR